MELGLHPKMQKLKTTNTTFQSSNISLSLEAQNLSHPDVIFTLSSFWEIVFYTFVDNAPSKAGRHEMPQESKATESFFLYFYFLSLFSFSFLYLNFKFILNTRSSRCCLVFLFFLFLLKKYKHVCWCILFFFYVFFFFFGS